MGLLVTGILKSVKTSEYNGVTYYAAVVGEEKFDATGQLIGEDQTRLNLLEQSYLSAKKLVNQPVVIRVEVSAYQGQVRMNNGVVLADTIESVPA